MFDPQAFVDGCLAEVDAAFEVGAAFMAEQLSTILGEQAPLMPGVSPPRAATFADPGAPPRRVSGKLQSHIAFKQDGVGAWSFGISAGPFYARRLEFMMNHVFFQRVWDQNLPELKEMILFKIKGGR